jgi:hypothetical protein
MCIYCGVMYYNEHTVARSRVSHIRNFLTRQIFINSVGFVSCEFVLYMLMYLLTFKAKRVLLCSYVPWFRKVSQTNEWVTIVGAL